MTNEEAKVFLDNLKICINEHPVVADWLVEIADRKTEPQRDKEIILDPSFAELSDEQFVEAMKLIEPQTDCSWK